MPPLNITQPLGIWSIMATIRWCPIFPKWDSYQPLINHYENHQEKNHQEPRSPAYRSTWSFGHGLQHGGQASNGPAGWSRCRRCRHRRHRWHRCLGGPKTMGISRDWYPLVNVYITNWKITMLFMGKLTISTGPVSIAMLNYQRVYCFFLIRHGILDGQWGSNIFQWDFIFWMDILIKNL